MLGKVFKHEMKSSSRLFIPLFMGFLAVTLLCKFSAECANTLQFSPRIMNTISALFMVLYFIYAIALFVMTAVFIVMHFYKTMISDQGYLTHTLPVKTSTMINGKLLSAILWQILSCILFILSIFIFAAGHFNFNDIRVFWQDLGEVIGEISKYINLPLFTVEITLCAIAGLFSGPLMMYASLALGHLFRKHRVLFAVVSYFAIYIAMQIISSVVIGYMGSHFDYSQGLASSYSASVGQSYLLFQTLFAIATAVGFYAVTDYIFSRKLNLE